MPSFDNSFRLEEFNALYSPNTIDNTNFILKLFLEFINNQVLLENTVKENDEKNFPPAITFANYYRSELSDNVTDDVKQLIGALWSYMFLNVNHESYLSKISKTYNDHFLFATASYYEKKIMRVCVEETMFATRSVAYVCEYKDMIKLLIPHCDSILENDTNAYSNLISYYVNHYFVEDDTSIDRKVCRYNGTNMKECLKNESCLFVLKKDDLFINEWLKKDTIVKELNQAIVEYNKALADNLEKYLKLFPKDTSLPHYKNDNNMYEIIEVVKEIKRDFKEARFKVTNYYAKVDAEKDDFSWFGQVSKTESKIGDLFDVLRIIDKATYRILVYVNKSGLLSISLVDTLLEKVKWDNDLYDSKNDNRLVDVANSVSINCENKMHSLCKLFDYLNFNQIFNDKKFKQIILGLPFDKKNPSNKTRRVIKKVTKDIYERNNTFKSVYLRLTYNHKDIRNNDASATLFFDYLSLLVGESHSFDKKTLLDIVNNEDYTEEIRKKIDDLSNSRTTHIYYDDSQFTYSVMDQSSRMLDLNNVCGKETNFNYIQSHHHRLYSLWEFTSICDALMYCSLSILIHSYLMKEVHKDSKLVFKPLILASQHRLSKIYSEVNIKFHHLVFNSKGRNFPLVDKVFEKLGLIEIENKAKNTFDANWQFANLNNGRLYSRIAFYMSIATFFVSIIAFAWAGAVFIDFSVNPCVGYEWSSLLSALTSTDKFHLILVVAFVPIVILILLAIYDYFKMKIICRNLMRFLLHIHRKDLKTIKCDLQE